MKTFLMALTAVAGLALSQGVALAQHPIIRGIPAQDGHWIPPHRVRGVIIRHPVGHRVLGHRVIGIRPVGVRPIGIRPVGIRPIGIGPVGIHGIPVRPIGVRPAGIGPVHPVGVVVAPGKPVLTKGIPVDPAVGHVQEH